MTEFIDVEDARAIGEVAAQRATDRAEREEPGFSESAKAAILARLTPKGRQASSEDLTEHVRDSGIVFKDGRALGSIYAALKRDKKIRIVGECKRRHGHGTSGGHIWEQC